MIQNILILTAMVWFIHATTWERMIFFHIADWLDDHLPEWITMPLYGCPICMSPYWTIYLLAGMQYIGVDIATGMDIYQWIVCAMSVAGLSAIIVKFSEHDN